MNEMHKLILITGVQRSGASLIARILELCGAYVGKTNIMLENAKILEVSKIVIRDYSKASPFPEFEMIPLYWKDKIIAILKKERYDEKYIWMFKSTLLTQTWQIWNNAFPDAKWVIIRRRSADIINACLKTDYIRLFKSKENQSLVGAKNEQEAWLWWIHRYEETWSKMIIEGLNCKVIWPERMAIGDYGQIHELLEWLGLEWNRGIFDMIDPLINKTRRK